jgi:protease-4
MKERSWGCFTLFVLVLLAGSVLLNFLLVLTIGAKSGHGGSSTVEKVEEFDQELVDGSETASEKIAVVELSGPIMSNVAGLVGETMIDDVVYKLRQAAADDKVKAVILRIDSPGGEVNASDVLYHETAKVRAKKPVIVYMDSVAASGGYYTAMGGSWVMASELTITGSVGVIMQTINYKDLLGKVGVKSLTFKSGKMKDLLNPSRDITPEEQAFVQALIDETYSKFVGIVAKERKQDVNLLRNGLADGRILTGKQALEAGFVDQLGYFEEAVAQARERGKAEKAMVIRYRAPFHFSRLFRMFSESEMQKTIKIQVGPENLKLEAGKAYFLSTHLFNGL